MTDAPPPAVVSEEEWQRIWDGRMQLWLTAEAAAIAVGSAFFLTSLFSTMFFGHWDEFWGMMIPLVGGVLLTWLVAKELKWLERVGPKWNAALHKRFPKLIPLKDPNKPEQGVVFFTNLVRKYPQILPGILVVYLLLNDVFPSTDEIGLERAAGVIGKVGVVAAGAITWYWIRGMHSRPQAAAKFGAIAGFVTMMALGFVLSIVANVGLVPYGIVLKLVIVNALALGLIGYGGGLALERLPGVHIGIRVAIGVLAGTVASFLVFKLFGFPIPYAEYIVSALAWGICLIVYKPAKATFDVPPESLAEATSRSGGHPPSAVAATSAPPEAESQLPMAENPGYQAPAPPVPDTDKGAPLVAPPIIVDVAPPVGQPSPVPNIPEQGSEAQRTTAEVVPGGVPPIPPASAQPNRLHIVAADGPVPGSIKFAWDASEGAEFEVQWSDDPEFNRILGSSVSATSWDFIVSGLTPGRACWLRVRIGGDGPESPWSEPVSRVAPA